MLRTLSHCVDNESMPPKIIYLCLQNLSSGTSANQCFPLRRACLFLFLLSHPPLVKAPIREHLCNFYALLLTVLSMTVTGSSLPWITMFSQPLVFEGAMHLCFAVSERASEIPSVRTASWLFWLKCWRLRLIIICSLVDYAIDMTLPWDLDVICLCGLLVILLKFWLWVRHSCNNKIKQSSSKFFFCLFQFVNWITWGQARL